MMLHRHFEVQKKAEAAKGAGAKTGPEKFVSAIFPPDEGADEKPVEQTKRRGGRNRKNGE